MTQEPWACRCYECGNRLLHPTQVLNKGTRHAARGGSNYFYYDPAPSHKILVCDFIGAAPREVWHAVIPEFHHDD